MMQAFWFTYFSASVNLTLNLLAIAKFLVLYIEYVYFTPHRFISILKITFSQQENKNLSVICLMP